MSVGARVQPRGHTPYGYLETLPLWRDPNTGDVVQGASTSAVRTGLVWRNRIALDAGYKSLRRAFQAVLITHTHLDHVDQLFQLGLNGQRNDPGFPVFVPPAALPVLRDYFTAQARLSGCSTKINWSPRLSRCKLIPLAPADGWVEIDAAMAAQGAGATDAVESAGSDDDDAEPVLPAHLAAVGRQNLFVRAVALKHTVPTQGYVVGEGRRRLLPELRGATRAAIVARKRAGEPVTRPVIVPVMAYLCDGTSASLCDALHRLAREEESMPRLVIMECTFLDEPGADALAGRAKRRHASWAGLAPTLQQFPQVTFLLMHLSKRYTLSDVQVFARRLPAHVHMMPPHLGRLTSSPTACAAPAATLPTRKRDRPVAEGQSRKRHRAARAAPAPAPAAPAAAATAPAPFTLVTKDGLMRLFGRDAYAKANPAP